MDFILQFISSMFSKIIYHRKQLRNYCDTMNQFMSHFDTLLIDVDFPENFKVPVKYEPQSIHWSHEQVTIHSAILKYQGRRVTKLIYQRTLNMISNLWTWFCMKCWMIFQTCLPTSLM